MKYGNFEANSKLKKNIIELAGSLVLENGGETYRSEETVELLCVAFGAKSSHVIAMPTGIFMTIDHDEKSDTLVIRIKNRSVNLSNLDRVNSIARRLCEGSISLEEGERILQKIKAGRHFSRILMAFAAGLSAASFTLLFNGTWLDCLISTLCGFLCQFITSVVGRTDYANFFKSALGGLLTSAIAAAMVLSFGGNLEKIIIGAIMPLLPGLPITNAIRDLMRGDLISGGARLTESVLIAVALAAGVGISLSVYLKLGGVLI